MEWLLLSTISQLAVIATPNFSRVPSIKAKRFRNVFHRKLQAKKMWFIIVTLILLKSVIAQDVSPLYNQTSVIVNFISLDEAKGYEQRERFS